MGHAPAALLVYPAPIASDEPCAPPPPSSRQVMPFVLRRTKAQVLHDLPPKIIQDIYCDMSALQARQRGGREGNGSSRLNPCTRHALLNPPASPPPPCSPPPSYASAPACHPPPPCLGATVRGLPAVLRPHRGRGGGAQPAGGRRRRRGGRGGREWGQRRREGRRQRPACAAVPQAPLLTSGYGAGLEGAGGGWERGGRGGYRGMAPLRPANTREPSW